MFVLITGFSRTITGLLKEHNVQYSSFDILSDEEVRQGIKVNPYINEAGWPFSGKNP